MTRLISIGRNLIIRLVYDSIEAFQESHIIQMTPEYIGKLKGGCQVSEILHVGQSAFDDEPPEVRELMTVGRQIITSRYPGVSLDLKPEAGDEEAGKLRSITCDEVRAIMALEGEEGADV